MILAGDIGGTKTLLALADAGGIVCERRYASGEWTEFPALLRTFLAEAGTPSALTAACFGVAGPVEAGCARVTYLPWVVEGPALARDFAIGRVEVVNDFAAAAQGLPALGPDDLVTLQAGQAVADAPRLLLGAGTGLGVAALLQERDGGWRTVAGEGGHIGFAPADESQLALWRHLARPGGRVTAENVLSGPGLVAVHASLAAADLAGQCAPRSDPATIVAAAEAGDVRARQALDLFVAAYGAFAGDLALLFMARGGVYLGGGIAPKILGFLRDGGLVKAFGARATHAGLMAAFPLHVVIEERLGLLGALALAATHNPNHLPKY